MFAVCVPEIDGFCLNFSRLASETRSARNSIQNPLIDMLRQFSVSLNTCLTLSPAPASNVDA
jgi:hypothetical protein